LKELWSDRLLEILIANPSKLHFGQEVLYCDLQGLDYDLGDLHTPYPNIEEDVEFTKVLIVKKKLEENFQVWELNCIALFIPLKQILLASINFVDLHTCRTSH
jgi:hypothetical protein